MNVDKEDWKKLKKSINDLYWDEDRMSSSGVQTLNYISNLINKIDLRCSNKLFVVMENNVSNYETNNNIIGVTFSKDEARNIFKNAIKDLKKSVDFNILDAKDVDGNEIDDYDNKWVFVDDKDFFTLYLNGEYNTEHYEVSIKEIELTNERKKIIEKELV